MQDGDFLKRIKIIIAVFLTAIFCFNSVAYADLYDDKKDIQSEINQTEESIKNLQKEQEEILSEMSKIDNDIKDLCIQIEQAENSIEQTRADIEIKEQQIEKKKIQLEQADKERKKQYQAMKKRIKYFYEKSNNSILESMFSDNFSLFLNNEEFMGEIYENDRQLLEEYIQIFEKIKQIKKELQQKRQELIQKKHFFELQKLGLEENKQLLDNRMIELEIQNYSNSLDLDQLKTNATNLASKLADINTKIAQMQATRAQLVNYNYYNTTPVAATVNSSYQQPSSIQYNSSSDIVSYANQFVGNPYVWGGNSLTNGIDCSHFVWNVLKDTGHYNGGYYIAQQWPWLGTGVSSLSEARAGDVICYSGHVAIYDGNGKIIEAQSSNAGITNNRSATSSTILAIRRFD